MDMLRSTISSSDDDRKTTARSNTIAAVPAETNRKGNNQSQSSIPGGVVPRDANTLHASTTIGTKTVSSSSISSAASQEKQSEESTPAFDQVAWLKAYQQEKQRAAAKEESTASPQQLHCSQIPVVNGVHRAPSKWNTLNFEAHEMMYDFI